MNEDLDGLADPVVLEAAAAVKSVFDHSKGQSLDACIAVYRIFLMGAVGVMKQAGQPKEIVATNLRLYADLVEKEGTK